MIFTAQKEMLYPSIQSTGNCSTFQMHWVSAALRAYDTTSTSTINENKTEEIAKKPPTTYSPSYISLSTKYIEEKNQSAMQNSLNSLLSPREKPYGDDVTILKSDASNTCQNVDAIHPPVNTNHLTTTTTILSNEVPSFLKDDFETCSTSSSDEDSQDGIGSYDVTPLRPNSLMLTRLANEDEVGGDGNVITRSLISLVAEEDLPDFLVALNEKPIRYIFEEMEKPSTSSILKVTLNGPRNNSQSTNSSSSNRIRFCTDTPLAYAYSDEITALRSLQWEDGTIIEYSYFKEMEERELQNDPTMSLIHQWEQQLASESARPDPSFTEALLESTLSSAY
ncbi:unnamed protein product [Caenorhabditis angaria]|uniref:Uncharacterized protein n=1 Tax=Caenorhabditis angaria TaxID=860376 RepID=A0A9P1J2M6_9PELO|nr:unnamed protein product [Caenorhabditis angaria]